ncbi:MAG TPA: hypothetical protein VEK34_02590 [Methylocella sp.]|nr:hypothetical protein [Methylocella sp.]
MKIKFWHLEYDFDKDDAKIVIPIVLLLIAVTTTSISPAILIGASVIYFFSYFFVEDLIKKIIGAIPKAPLKCPKCKNRKIVLQGYQGYKSDEQYPYYLCTHCDTTSILTEGGLLDISNPPEVGGKKS